jgi:hypothetical protein
LNAKITKKEKESVFLDRSFQTFAPFAFKDDSQTDQLCALCASVVNTPCWSDAAMQPSAAPARKQRRGVLSPLEAGLADPRPVTDYTVSVASEETSTRVTIVLSQPCIIRSPSWAFIDNLDGSRVYADSMTILSNQSFYFDFAGLLPASVGIIEVPYQDREVQNFQGGFVRPGGRWFRRMS